MRQQKVSRRAKKKVNYLVSRRTFRLTLSRKAFKRINALYEMRSRLGESGLTVAGMLTEILEAYLSGETS